MELATESLSSGRGVQWELHADWWLPPVAVIVGGILVVLALGALSWRGSDLPRESSGGGWRGRWFLLWMLRSGVVAILCWMLGQWQIRRYETVLPDLLLAIDTSASMQLPATSAEDAQGDTSRWGRVQKYLVQEGRESLSELARRYHLRMVFLGERTIPLPQSLDLALERIAAQTASGTESRLGDQLRELAAAQRGRSTAAMILISDGVVTGGASLAEVASEIEQQRVPVFTLPIGSDLPPPQVAIAEVIGQPTAMVGDVVRVIVRILWSGTGGVPIELRMVDLQTGELLDESKVGEGRSDGVATADLTFTATAPGQRSVQILATPIRGERTLEDNQRGWVVDVRDQSYHVLLVQGGPSYEFRFLKHLLQRATTRSGQEPLVALTSVLQRGDPQYAQQDLTAASLPPVDDETLRRQDLIILSDCDPAALGNRWLEKIAELVTQGGSSLVVIAGPDSLPGAFATTPLERLLPIELQRAAAAPPLAGLYRWRLTPLGRGTPMLAMSAGSTAWEDAPGVYWLAQGGSLRPGARVLMEMVSEASQGAASQGVSSQGVASSGGAAPPAANPLPVLIGQYVGRGHVYLQMTDETFRLRGRDDEGGFYEQYWLQLVRGLSRTAQSLGDRDSALMLPGDRFYVGESIPFEIRLGRDLAAIAGSEVELVVTDLEQQTFVFRATASSDGPSRYLGELRDLGVGNYRAEILPLATAGAATTEEKRGGSTSFEIVTRSLELAELRADLAALREIANQTGGETLAIDRGLAAQADRFPAGRAVQTRALGEQPLWNHPLVALGLFSLLTLQWVLRRSWGGH